MTLARDNHIGMIVGEKSTYSPSHYGEVIPFRLPNTGVVGTVCSKFFARPDKEHVDDTCLLPDVMLDLKDKDAAWQRIIQLVKTHTTHAVRRGTADIILMSPSPPDTHAG